MTRTLLIPLAVAGLALFACGGVEVPPSGIEGKGDAILESFVVDEDQLHIVVGAKKLRVYAPSHDAEAQKILATAFCRLQAQRWCAGSPEPPAGVDVNCEAVEAYAAFEHEVTSLTHVQDIAVLEVSRSGAIEGVGKDLGGDREEVFSRIVCVEQPQSAAAPSIEQAPCACDCVASWYGGTTNVTVAKNAGSNPRDHWYTFPELDAETCSSKKGVCHGYAGAQFYNNGELKNCAVRWGEP